jgi:hypothetical protein
MAGGGFTTVFPQAIGLAATVDAPRLKQMRSPSRAKVA